MKIESNKDCLDITQCPVCKKTNLKRVLVHISKSKCRSKCSKEILNELKQRSNELTLTKRKEIMREKRKNADFKKQENEKKKNFMKMKRSERREENYEPDKESERKRIRILREKQREENEIKLMEANRNLQRNARKNETANERLKSFLQGTMHNAVFICICCNVRCFKTNVVQFTNTVREKISCKNPNILKSCISDEEIPCNFQTEHHHEKWPDSYRDKDKSWNMEYICNTCLQYLKKNKMPPTCIKNGLEIQKTIEDLKSEDLILTDLEGSLIARSILFMKIFQLPTSRWTAMTDKCVNVPIPESSILNTIKMLPRTPTDAGLISVNLKRKKEFKTNHISQLINPERIFRMLKNLKDNKNPHYKFYDDYSAYKDRCIKTDPKGSKLLYDDLVEENLENLEMTHKNFELLDELIGNEELDTEDDEESETENDRQNDPIQKYNFNYDKNVCLTDKYPEISVAPGEGQTPKDILMEDDWDIKAFPHIHNFDGSNGLGQEREVRLTDQKYFIQRICNKNTKFSKCQPYLYAAVCSLERKQLQRNINLAGTRGKKIVKSSGVSYELQDSFRVLEGIKNTPKYWKTAKYEIIAKIENFGAFQFFFTLSCADMRWTSNFAPILLDMNYKLNYKLEKDEYGNWVTIIKGRKDTEDWRDIMDIIKDFEGSQHEIIRQNVLNATRYFNHRVRQFISKILLSANNPLNVKFYSYKVEFQQRGAGKFFFLYISQIICLCVHVSVNLPICL